jgi:isochorismate synthase
MGDVLHYRLPNQEKVELTGFFKEVTAEIPENSFIVSDFQGTTWYSFVPSSSNSIFHSDNKLPLIISKENYIHQASEIVQELNTTALEKVVYSRIKEAQIKTTNYKQLFDELCDRYPSTLVYLISSPKFGTWMGASPEQLIVIENGNGSTTALAGTKKSDDSTPWENKEQTEQAIVTSYLLEQLHTLNIPIKEIDGPNEFQAGPVKHLKTNILFSSTTIPPINIAKQLHPTPAVSGYPKQEALSYLAKIEAHNRSLYTGVIGFYATNNTQLFVNLRCCQLEEDRAFIYLGGGFTKDSIPLKEWEETENKSKTLLNILQNP